VESNRARTVATAAARSLTLGIVLVVGAFAVEHGAHFVRNLPKHHWEDGRHFHHNRAHIHSLLDCFTQPSAWAGGAEATYRPLSANLYYYLGRRLFDNRPEVYHALDGAVFVLNAVLLLLICRELLPAPAAILPPVLFASRWAHAQDFAYTSNFDTLSYVALSLAGLLLFIRARRTERRGPEVLAALAFGLALFCKEGAVVWPAILTVYGWLFDRASAWRKYATAWILTGVWAVAYIQITHRLYPADQPGFRLDLTPPGLLSRYAAYALAFFNTLVPKVDPEGQGWAMPPEVSALSGTAPAIVLVAALVVIEVALLLRARIRPAAVGSAVRVATFGVAWFLVATAPYAVLAHRLFIRYSYFGHAGLALAVGGATVAATQSVIDHLPHARTATASAPSAAVPEPSVPS
jgi:hypothetical protein